MLTIYALGTLLVLCYILFRFHYRKRIRKEALENGQSPSDGEPDELDQAGIKTRLNFCYERDWSRRLGVFCLLVLIASFGFSIHTELLSNFSQTRIQAEQAKKLTKTMKKENEDHRIMLDGLEENATTPITVLGVNEEGKQKLKSV